MKTVTYTLTAQEQTDLISNAKNIFNKLQAGYQKNPAHYRQPIHSLVPMWIEVAKVTAIFKQLENDGIASISKESDEYSTFADYAGEMYDPEMNDDIDPEELKTQRRRALARFNRAGVWFHTLYVFGKESDSIGGCVGNDFYGSGYDVDFYSSALESVKIQLLDYYYQLIDTVNTCQFETK